MDQAINIEGFVLTEVQAQGLFYKLTFEREIRPEQLVENKLPPKIESISKFKHGEDEEGLSKYIEQGMKTVFQVQSQLHGYPQTGPTQTIHMHLLKSEHPWVKDLHIEETHSITVKQETG